MEQDKDKISSKVNVAVKRLSSSDQLSSKEMEKKKLLSIQTRIRIKLRSYDHKIIDSSSKQIIETALRYNSEVIGPIPLPTKIKKYTVNRSTFVHKKSRDQFEMRIHKRLIDILNPNPEVIKSLTHLNLPSGIDVEIKFS